MARRAHSLHHNLQPGQNVVFHREHRSKKNRNQNYRKHRNLQGYLHERRERQIERRVKKTIRDFVKGVGRREMTA